MGPFQVGRLLVKKGAESSRATAKPGEQVAGLHPSKQFDWLLL